MADYYIRSPESAESRGPFDLNKMLTLAEAGQITENTLYYDEEKEEWVPLGANSALCAEVFPVHQKLELKPDLNKHSKKLKLNKSMDDEVSGEGVEDMLAAAEGVTSDTKHVKARAKSFEKASYFATNGIALAMLLSAAYLLIPQSATLITHISEQTYTQLLTYPFMCVALLDLALALFLFLAATEFYGMLRARSMITVGFALVVGWSLGDTLLMAVWAAGGVGVFLATISQRFSTMILALVLGIGGNSAMVYFAVMGRLSGFFDTAQFILPE